MKLIYTDRLLLRSIASESTEVSKNSQQSQAAVRSDTPPKSSLGNRSVAQWQPLVIRRSTAAVVGVVLIATSAKTTHLPNFVPQYEGRFQIAIAAETALANGTEISQIEGTNPAVLAPSLNYQAQIRVFESPRLIDPVVERLRAQGLETDYKSLTDNLNIVYREQIGTVEVYYRDTNSDRVQLVLRQIAQAYLQEGRDCQTDACRGVQYIEEHLLQTQNQVLALRSELQTFRQQYGFTSPETQQQLLSLYAAEIAKQEADIQIKLLEVGDRYKALQRQLALEPSVEHIAIALNRDQNYRFLLNQLQSSEEQITAEFSNSQINQSRLEALYNQHQALLMQLRHQAQQILAQQLANNANGLQESVAQNENILPRLQQWVDTASYLQVLEIRQHTIASVKRHLDRRLEQWVDLSRRYDELQQKLQVATNSLNQYLNEREMLQATAAVQEPFWQLVAPPETLPDRLNWK